MSKSKFLKSATLAIAGIAVATASSQAFAAPKMEKCYGVVKAGKNDCSSAKPGAHSCAGASNTDGDTNEWILLPKGTCDRLVNGLLR